MKPTRNKLIATIAMTLALLGGGLAALQARAGHPLLPGETQRIVQDGVAVDLRIRPLAGGEAVLEGQNAELTLALTDAETGEVIPGLTLAAWVDHDREEDPATYEVCRDKIESYIQGDLKTRPVLDLNSYVVLALNEGRSISVIDPFLGFGNTNLYGTVILDDQGEDWVLDAAETRLFVTMPGIAQVAVVDTDEWAVVQNVDVGTQPTEIALQPDGKGVWVLDGEGEDGERGVTIFDPVSLDVMARIPTGVGSRSLVFSDDGEIAYVANRGSGTVSVIDVPSLQKLGDLQTGPRPTGIGYSKTARAAFVADEEDGSISAIDRDSHGVRMRVVTNPGITAVEFDKMMGRWGFVVNSREAVAHIIDGTTDEVVHTLETGDVPDQISFTHNFAYIRSLGSAEVTMVALSTLRDGNYEEMWPFPAGALPPGGYNGAVLADAVVPSPEMHDAVYVANPGEKRIYVYHYMEGMPTPSGTLDNYGFSPRAVMTVGRAINEVSDGVYQTVIKAPPPGDYDFVFLLEDPRIIHCFDLPVDVDPDKDPEELEPALKVVPVDAGTPLPVGRSFTFEFSLRDENAGEAREGLEDAVVMMLSPQGWQRRVAATPRPDGSYTIDVTIPYGGPIYVFVASPSLGVGFDQPRPTILRAAREQG